MNTNERYYKDAQEVQEAERAFLGCVFIDSRELDSLLSGFTFEVFLDPRNSLIFTAMTALHEKNVKCDYLTVRTELERMGKEEKAGGIAYICTLTDGSFSGSNASYYEDIIMRAFLKRRMISIFQEERTKALEPSQNVTDILDEASSRLTELAVRGSDRPTKDCRTLLIETIHQIDSRIKDSGNLAGIPSGFEGLDVLTQGFMKSEFTVIGARPSMGKTALLLSMMSFACFTKKVSALFFSLEMSSPQIGIRLLSMKTRISIYKIRSGLMTGEEFKKIDASGNMMAGSPLYISDTPNMKLLDLKMEARRAVREKGVRIIYIDYMGLIESPHPDAPVYEQQSEVSRSLKSLSRELDVPVVALCQVTRSAEGKEPTLAELRGSGSIEQDADCVMFIHGERSLDAGDTSSLPRKLIVAKQRNGPVGTVDLEFNGATTNFFEVRK